MAGSGCSASAAATGVREDRGEGIERGLRALLRVRGADELPIDLFLRGLRFTVELIVAREISGVKCRWEVVYDGLFRGGLPGLLVGIDAILPGSKHVVVLIMSIHPLLHGHAVQLLVAVRAARF